MQIDSVLPNRTSPGQSVIIQGESLETAEKVFFSNQEVPFSIDGESLVADVPDRPGPVEVTVESDSGTSNAYNITID